MASSKPLRWTERKVAAEMSWVQAGLIALAVWLLWRPFKSFCSLFPRPRAIMHHPILLAVLVVMFIGMLINPLIPVVMLVQMAGATIAVKLAAPNVYRTHIAPRLGGFKAGFSVRYQFRAKMMGCRIIQKEEKTPLPYDTLRYGCTTKVYIKMVYGDFIDYYRERAEALAPTFNSLDAKLRPVRRRRLIIKKRWPFIGFKQRTRPRLMEMELLAENPFEEPIGVEYIDFHYDEARPLPLQGNALAPYRDGRPHRRPIGRSNLTVAEPGGGKSGVIRAMVYADRHAIRLQLIEYWGFDGKKGVEISYMEHMFAHVCYGKKDGDTGAFDTAAIADFWAEVAGLVLVRLDFLEQIGQVQHIPTPAAPALRIVADELLILDMMAFKLEGVWKKIWADIEIVNRLGRAACVDIQGFAQDASMEDLPGRRTFPDREIGRVKEKIQVDMAAGRGVWERGGKADHIPYGQAGTFYVERDGGTTPEETRYPQVTDAEVDAMKSHPAPESVLWKKPAVEPVVAPQWGNPPERPIRALPEITDSDVPASASPIRNDGDGQNKRSGPSFGGFGNR